MELPRRFGRNAAARHLPTAVRGPTVGAVEPLVITYRIDADDRLVGMNEAWTAFAEQNRGENAVPEKVIGRPLWDFVVDLSLQELYKRMVRRARDGQPVSFRYRCDAPHERRVFLMQISHVGAGVVEFRSELMTAETRPAVRWLDPGARHGPTLVRLCSWCGRVALPDGRWVAVERAMEEHGALQQAEAPSLTHGMCEQCADQMTSLLRAGPKADGGLNEIPE
jgi:hypothetical protein